MKKTLIALAAVAATSAAFAQSSVTVFGVVDAGYNSKSWKADGGKNAKSTGVVDGALAGSRFGFRGVEDLGGGLKAEFIIEQGLSPTSAGLTNARTATSGFQIEGYSPSLTGRSTTSLNRQSFLGVSGGFGAVRLGYQYTNVYELATLSGYHAGSEAVHGADFAHVAGSAYVGGTRANAITYISPKFGGFTAQFQYGAGTGLQSFENNITADGQFEAKRTSIMGKYAAGPLSAALSYTAFKNGTTTGGAASGPSTVTANLTQFGASYDFGMAKVGFTYNTGDNDIADKTSYREVDAYSLSASVPFGSTSLVVAYHDIDEKNGNGTKITDGSGYQFGVVHSLSKRTAAYAFYGRNKFKTTTSPVALTNLKQTDITVGVRHSF